ncbi:M13 family metallopeptidase [Undibacterium sp. 5I2]|nr:M13 family metallopeptidase [Undibacterium sp. 5I2]
MIASTTGMAPASAATTAAAPALIMGEVDGSARAQDDFFWHVNGAWIKAAQIPADRSSINPFVELDEGVRTRLHSLIEDIAKGKHKTGSEEQKISDLYLSFMDTKQIESLGLKPLNAEFAQIDALTDKQQIPALMAWFNLRGINAPYAIQVHQDNKDSSKYVLDIGQSGLGLPDRDYYLKADDAKLNDARRKYQLHIEKMLRMAGQAHAADSAKAIVAFETALATIQWDKVALRDPIKAYNNIALNKLDELTPGYDWTSYLSALGVSGKIDRVIIGQPTYLSGLNQLLQTTPLATLKQVLKWNLLSSAASQLPQQFDAEHFAFYDQVLRGVPKQQVRWKRGVNLVDSGLGESLGKEYAARYFPAQSKTKMEQLVANLLVTYKNSIDTLDWMSPETKKEAQTKLALFKSKIGYPNQWRDYSSLQISKGNPVANLRNIRLHANQTELAKLGKPVDRETWEMTPQTVNAYYNPEMNEIVFPAAILQAPFFDAKADDATNYGAIGVVIGHEISHGFDDQGAQYDGLGNLRDWWTADDHAKFTVKTAALIKQYNSYSPVAGYFVNGALTLGENIADNSGLAIAYKAYQLSLGGRPAPVINGLSGDQRFFLGFARSWQNKMRDEESIVRTKTDPHSPPQFRINGTLRNMTPFYRTYDVKSGDKMYLPPAERVSIW